ncbi:MAG: DUF507 family protein [Myxococcales bacterium]|jgi:hypothetical protein|nr:DUF507 family protein [Myxococcales bacterium]
MRLFASKALPIAQDAVRALLKSESIEAESPNEVIADVEAVLKSYVETEREVSEKTRDLLERTGRGNAEFGRVKAQIAESKGIKVGDDMLDYLLDQVVEAFHHSAHVDEIFAQDHELRRAMVPHFKRHLAVDEGLDAEVRLQLRHLQEGTRTWDVEYARVMEAVRRKRGV